MSFNQQSAIQRAKEDLAQRLGVSEDEIQLDSVAEKDFPNTALGALVEDEMSGQMISSGWQIDLNANGETFEYRADKYQLRLRGFEGTNHIIES